jgi:hypothetical protein
VLIGTIRGTVELARRAERGVRGRVADGVGQVTLAVVDWTLASPRMDEAVGRVADRLLADGIAEQVTARLLRGPELERIVALVLESEALRDAVANALESEGAERLLARALESPGAERLLTFALESPDTERMLARIVESRIVDEAVVRLANEAALRLPESPAIWALVEEIAASPAVSEALTKQGAGFADQVAGEVRERSRSVDARLERAARRLIRRSPRTSAPAT